MYECTIAAGRWLAACLSYYYVKKWECIHKIHLILDAYCLFFLFVFFCFLFISLVCLWGSLSKDRFLLLVNNFLISVLKMKFLIALSIFVAINLSKADVNVGNQENTQLKSQLRKFKLCLIILNFKYLLSFFTLNLSIQWRSRRWSCSRIIFVH